MGQGRRVVSLAHRSGVAVLAGLPVSLGLVLAIAAGGAKDITAQVLRETDLGQRIHDACDAYCQGNRRKGSLTRVLVSRLDTHRFSVRADASLLNWQHEEPPKFRGQPIGKGFDVYNYAIEVEAHGTLDDRDCRLRIDAIKIVNDPLNLGALARRHEGTVHAIDRCRRFLDGL